MHESGWLSQDVFSNAKADPNGPKTPFKGHGSESVERDNPKPKRQRNRKPKQDAAGTADAKPDEKPAEEKKAESAPAEESKKPAEPRPQTAKAPRKEQ